MLGAEDVQRTRSEGNQLLQVAKRRGTPAVFLLARKAIGDEYREVVF